LHAHCPGRDRKEKKGRKEKSFGRKVARFNHKNVKKISVAALVLKQKRVAQGIVSLKGVARQLRSEQKERVDAIFEEVRKRRRMASVKAKERFVLRCNEIAKDSHSDDIESVKCSYHKRDKGGCTCNVCRDVHIFSSYSCVCKCSNSGKRSKADNIGLVDVETNPGPSSAIFDMNIGDIICVIPTDYSYTEEPTMYECESFPHFNTNVNLQETQVLISGEDFHGKLSRFDDFRIIIDTSDDKLRKIRHEIVSSMCRGGTDIPFSMIDPYYDPSNPETFHKMTPDYFDSVGRSIGELSTSASSNGKYMKSRYDSKLLTYSPYLTQVDILQYFIFIVSPTCVLSNFPLDQVVVDELCARMRFGISVESALIDELGEDFFQESEEVTDNGIVVSVLASLKSGFTRMRGGDVMYNKNILKASLEPLTDQEREHSIKLLQKSWDRTSNAVRSDRRPLDLYLESFTDNNTRLPSDMKRVCNFPMVYCNKVDTEDVPDMEFSVSEISNSGLRTIWSQAFDEGVTTRVERLDEDSIVKEAMSPHEYNKHQFKRATTFKVVVDDVDRDILADCGIQAKINSYIPDDHKHKGFHPMANTDDIQDFIYSEECRSGNTTCI
jgi:hypothetical protein